MEPVVCTPLSSRTKQVPLPYNMSTMVNFGPFTPFQDLQRMFKSAQRSGERIPVATIHGDSPKFTARVFQNRTHINCVGFKSTEVGRFVLQTLRLRLDAAFGPGRYHFFNYTVNNHVLTVKLDVKYLNMQKVYDLTRRLDVVPKSADEKKAAGDKKLLLERGESARYEVVGHRSFPGMLSRLKGDLSMMVFDTGKINFIGATNLVNVHEMYEELYPQMMECRYTEQYLPTAIDRQRARHDLHRHIHDRQKMDVAQGHLGVIQRPTAVTKHYGEATQQVPRLTREKATPPRAFWPGDLVEHEWSPIPEADLVTAAPPATRDMLLDPHRHVVELQALCKFVVWYLRRNYELFPAFLDVFSQTTKAANVCGMLVILVFACARELQIAALFDPDEPAEFMRTAEAVAFMLRNSSFNTCNPLQVALPLVLWQTFLYARAAPAPLFPSATTELQDYMDKKAKKRAGTAGGPRSVTKQPKSTGRKRQKNTVVSDS